MGNFGIWEYEPASFCVHTKIEVIHFSTFRYYSYAVIMEGALEEILFGADSNSSLCSLGLEYISSLYLGVAILPVWFWTKLLLFHYVAQKYTSLEVLLCCYKKNISVLRSCLPQKIETRTLTLLMSLHPPMVHPLLFFIHLLNRLSSPGPFFCSIDAAWTRNTASTTCYSSSLILPEPMPQSPSMCGNV